MQAVPMILMAVGSAVSTYGMVQQGKNAEAQAEAQADLMRNNALQNKYDAQFNESAARANEKAALYEGESQQDQMSRAQKREKATAKTTLAGQGLDIGSISFKDTLHAVALDHGFQRSAQRYQTAIGGQDLRAQGLGFQRRGQRAFAIGQFEASATRAAGRNQRSAANISAAGNFASGMGSAGLAGYQTGFFGG